MDKKSKFTTFWHSISNKRVTFAPFLSEKTVWQAICYYSKRKNKNTDMSKKEHKFNEEEALKEENINEPAIEETEKTENEEAPLTEEEMLRKELDEANAKNAELNDKYLRQVAEFDNYRKRTVKEKAELIKNGGERTIESILPILDDFERALVNMAKDENAKEILTGIELIYNKFISVLKQNGLQKIETEGKDFDTDYHEAIAMIPAPSEDLKGKVLDCVQTGYILNEKVIRHAKVAVGE